MEYFVVGQVVRLTHSVYDDAGALVNATTVTLTINLPDGTSVTPTVTNTGTGQYRVDYQAAQAGRYTYAWTTTGPTAPDDGSFDVHPLTQGIVSLADARAATNMVSNAHDEELRGFIEATTRVVEDIVGPVVARSYTERHDGGRMLILGRAPIIAVTSVTPASGPAYASADLDVDLAAGIVRLTGGGSFRGGPFTVVYTAGRQVVPSNITEAAKIVIKHLWDTQRGPGLPRFGEAEALPTPGIGYALPNRARDLLAPDRIGPLVA